MALILRRSGSNSAEKYSVLNEDEEHIQILTSVTENVSNAKRYGRRVDTFLEDLFGGDSPLEFSKHRVLQTGTGYRIMVTFKLSKDATEADVTFDEAATQFCTLICKPLARRYLGTLTDKSVLGISPVCSRFKQLWKKSFMVQYQEDSSSLLNSIHTSFDQEYLPDWAMVLCFTAVSAFNVSGIFGEKVSQLASSEPVQKAIDLAKGVLRTFASKQPSRSLAETQREWGPIWHQYQTNMNRAADILKDTIDANSHFNGDLLGNDTRVEQGLTHIEVLCEALFDATHAAAKANTLNLEMFEIFIRERENAIDKMAIGAVGSFGALAAYSTAWATTTSLVAVPATTLGGSILASLGMGEMAVVTTTVCACPPLAVLAGVGVVAGVVVYFKNNKKRVEFNRQIDLRREMNKLIKVGWDVTYHTQVFLSWVHVLDAATPNQLDFTSQESRMKWAQFMQQAQGVNNVSSEQLKAQYVLTYLDTRQSELKKLCQKIGEIGAQG